MKNAATIDKGSRPTFGWLLLLVQVILSSADNNEVLQCWRSELRHWARLDSTHSTRLLDSQKERSCLAWSHLVLEKFGWMERICACARIPNHCLHTTH